MKKSYIIFDLNGTIIDTVEKMYQIIINEINSKTSFNKEEIVNILNKNNGKGIKDILAILLPNLPKSELIEIEKNILNLSLRSLDKSIFRKGIISLIEEMSIRYKLFLSSGNHIDYVNNVLDLGGIKGCFTKVLGSQEITKSEKHLEIFKKIVKDEDFYSKSIYIGDGKTDELNAKKKGIDFIVMRNYHNKNLIKSFILEIGDLNILRSIFIEKYSIKIMEKKVLFNKYVKVIQKDFLDSNLNKSSFLVYGHNKKRTVGTFILPITINNEIIYIKEYRAGPEKYVISFPVGALEDNLSEIENCKKELLEETGYVSNDFEYLGESIIENNFEYLGESIIENNFEGKSVYYIARNCEYIKKQDLDVGEDIKVYKSSISDFKKMILSGEINFAKTVYCFFLAEFKGYFK
ncbi:hypothetical protein CSB07_00235 [Candidatus Gracilibacteria bacterium]|nr:MAG: hypothetical protein CSB07_00235 [Candidatus Gracilibacteria bacterium]PIE85652.1 MAG: hypothetical protein CSA08_00945 [Candidatus Gracilibacteria bacterium]